MELLDPLLDPWRSGIGRRALLEVILVGGFCGALGFWVVSFRLSYGAESLAHGMLPGLVIAALAGAPLLLGAAGGVLVAAALVALAARDERIGSDTAVAVAVTGLVGLGALLALEPDVPPRLEELLFGDPLAAADSDLVAAALLTCLGGLALVALHRPLSVVAFDPGASRPLGISATAVSLALLGAPGPHPGRRHPRPWEPARSRRGRGARGGAARADQRAGACDGGRGGVGRALGRRRDLRLVPSGRRGRGLRGPGAVRRRPRGSARARRPRR